MTDPLAANRRFVEISVKPTFIIGSPRSGTTILAWSLAQHSQLWTSEESVILEDLYGVARVHNSYQSVTLTPVKNWFKAEHMGKQELLQYLGIGVNALFSSRSQGKRWIDQTPSYTFMADTLADMFPDARFLHILRDGRHVVNSMINFVNAIEDETRAERIETGLLPAWATDFRMACKTWRRYILKAVRFSSERPERCLTVRYEQLVADPKLCFSNVLQFLDLDHESAPAEHFESNRINSSFSNRAFDPWSAWSPDQKFTFIEEAGEALVTAGTIDSDQLDDLKREATSALQAAPHRPDQRTGQDPYGFKASSASLQDNDQSRYFYGAFPDTLICQKPIFVIGAQRSGTSILTRSLAKHTELWYSIEGDIFYHLFGPDRIDEVYGQRSKNDWSWFAREKVGRDEFLQTAGLGINALYTSRSGGKQWIEKLPENSLMAEVLAIMFPGALFINVERDARYAVNSGFRKRANFPSDRDFVSACLAWRSFAEKASAFAIDHPFRCMTIRYEDVITRPEDTFAAILEFLALRFEDQCAEHFRAHRFNSSFSDLADGTPSDPWRQWTLEQRRIFLREAGPLMVKLGQLNEDELRELEQEVLIKSG